MNTKNSRFALLLAAPLEGEVTMHNDAVAMYDALLTRGFSSEDILLLEGKFNRELIMFVIREINERVAAWEGGDIFFYFSGHGMYSGDTASEARVRMLLRNDQPPGTIHGVFWDEIFAALRLPPNVRLILLPDC